MAKPIKIPGNLAELLADPQRVRDAFLLLNALATFQTVLEQPSGNNTLARGPISLVGDPPNLTLRLPFKNSAAIADPLANTSGNTAAIIAILNWARLVGFIPS